MTGVDSPLAANPDGLTLLIGYDPDTGAYAGFDLTQHTVFTAGSPSVQVDRDCLFQALQEGIAFRRKNNDEVAVGVRADYLLHYSLHSKTLHGLGKESGMPEMLTQASTGSRIEPEQVEALGNERQKVLTNVSKWARSAGFRRQVLTAYENRCAVTRMQLRLVDAAHILPVHDERSTDSVTNGIALSPTYHRAFDHGLIYLDEHFVMRLNTSAKERLSALNLTGGIRQLEDSLDCRIHLPQDPRQRPSAMMIRQANKLRRINA